MKTRMLLFLAVFASMTVLAAPGRIVLLNGTSSAGKSSLAEVLVRDSTNAFEVVSFDDFHRSYRKEHGIVRFSPQQYQEFLVALYRHAKSRSDAGRHVIIDTVEFELGYDRYCEILNCSNTIKAVVYCPLDQILKRIDKRNSAPDPSGNRPVLLSFQQFLQMYKPQTSPDELIVERTTASRIRSALAEAGKKAGDRKRYEALYSQYVKVFGIDRDREIVIVPRRKYDLVINTRANTKRENARRLDGYLNRRAGPSEPRSAAVSSPSAR
jgi:chloramphenicol 3-O phosphotransferase